MWLSAFWWRSVEVVGTWWVVEEVVVEVAGNAEMTGWWAGSWWSSLTGAAKDGVASMDLYVGW